MPEIRFSTEEEAAEELRRHPAGWFAYEEGEEWVVREYSFEERREQRKFDDEAVVVSFPTTADLSADEMTDEDWIGLGKLVATVAVARRAELERAS